jgi:hypothetical protein
MTNFRVGQKVVCIDASSRFGGWGIEWAAGEAPIEGHIYTVIRSYCFAGLPCLWLAEIKRSQSAQAIHGPDVGYHADRFRPLVTRKTDISIFKAMLNPSRVDA